MSFAPASARRSERGGSRAGSRAGSVRSVATGMSRVSSASHLSTRRLEKLRDLQRRAMLGDTLKSKASLKHGHKLPASIMDAEISKITSVSRDRVTKDDLRRLEADLNARAGEFTTPRITARSSRPGTSASMSSLPRPGTSDTVRTADLDKVLAKTEGKVWGGWSAAGPSLPPKPKISPRSKSKEEWALIMKYEQLKADEQEKLKKTDVMKAREELRAFLAEQLAAKKEVKDSEHGEHKVWAKVFEEDRIKHEAEEAEKIRIARERNEAEKVAREEQIAYRSKQQAREAKARAKYEKELLAKALREAEEIEAKEKEKKLLLKAKYRQIFVDNQKELEHKRMKALAEQEEDVARMKEYARLMDLQEKKREEMFAERARKLEKMAEQKVAYEQEDTSGKILMSPEKYAALEAERMRQLEAEMAEKQRKKREADQACAAFVDLQLKAKEEVRRKEREEGERHAEAAKAKLIEYERELEEQDTKRRLANLQYKKDLEVQISSRVAAKNSMSEIERKLNAKKVDEAMTTLRSVGVLSDD